MSVCLNFQTQSSCIGVLSKAGISQNDLPLRNIVIKPATIVCFSGKSFVTRAVPVIIDWDMGCSTRRHNRSLSDYNYHTSESSTPTLARSNR